MKVGQKAPDFKLKDRRGVAYSLKDFKGKSLIVYFYPKDDTPGCTLQAKAYSAALPAFKKLGYEVVGISGGDEASKRKFCLKHRLKVTLLSDPDFKVAKKYGAWGTKVFMGRKYFGIHRNTYILDTKHRVRETLRKVDPENDSRNILKLLNGKKPPTAKKMPSKKASSKKVARRKVSTARPANRARKLPSPRKLVARRKAGSLMRTR